MHFYTRIVTWTMNERCFPKQQRSRSLGHIVALSFGAINYTTLASLTSNRLICEQPLLGPTSSKRPEAWPQWPKPPLWHRGVCMSLCCFWKCASLTGHDLVIRCGPFSRNQTLGGAIKRLKHKSRMHALLTPWKNADVSTLCFLGTAKHLLCVLNDR